MKLAEALAERADTMRRYQQVCQRLQRYARVQVGDCPAEDPSDLLALANAHLNHLDYLIRHINTTNSTTRFSNSLSLSDAVSYRDNTLKRRKLFADTASCAASPQERRSRNEVKFVSSISVNDLQRLADRLSRDYRTLDTAIQRLNWTVDLL